MLKMDKKGFALVETLIVTVFVATIFTVMYTNFFPMFGEYERREGYDDIDSIYTTYLIKRMLENPNFRTGINYDQFNNQSYIEIYSVDYNTDSNSISETGTTNQQIENACKDLISEEINLSIDNTTYDYCINLMTKAQVQKIYLTNYNLKDLKPKIKQGISESQMDAQMQEYIDSLPYYTKNNSGCNYRIIVEYVSEAIKISGNNKKIMYSFSTIGVNL